MYTTSTFKIKALYLVTFVQLVYTTVEVQVMVYTVLAYSYYVGFYDALMMHFNFKFTPTNISNYSCHMKPV